MHISFGRNFLDTTPKGRDVSFEQFVRLCRSPRHHGRLSAREYMAADSAGRRRDKDGPWFIAGLFMPAERRTACLHSLSGFVCDFDSGAVTRQTIESIFGDAGPLEHTQFVAWTSYSHGVERKERWRVFIPYAAPITPERHKDAYAFFNAIFGGHLDASCAKPAQLWYLPGCPRDAAIISAVLESGERAPPFNCDLVPATVGDVSRRTATDATLRGELAAVLQSAVERNANDDLAAGVGYAPPTLRELIEMVAVLPKQEYGDYEPWLKVGMALHHGTNGSEMGEKIYDRWSATLPNYDPAAVAAKWRSFGGRVGGISVGSLIALARTAGWCAELPDPTPAAAVDGEFAIHSTVGVPPADPIQLTLPLASVTMPPRFRNTTSPLGIPQISKMQPAPDGSGRDMLASILTGYHLVRVESLANKDDGVNTGEFEFIKPAGRIVVRVPTAKLASIAELAESLNEKGVHVYRSEEKQAVQELMMDWLKKVQAEKRERNTVSKWGWVEPKGVIEGFAAGTTVYHSDGRQEPDAIVCTYPDLFQQYVPQGCLAEWQKCANFIAQQGQMPLVTILASAFAAPLVTLAGLDGVLVSVVSTKSGVGKTTAMQTAQAVWGGRKAMHGTDDTVNAFGVKMGVIQNLPCYWDDIKGETAFNKLPDLAYQITNGREKSRSNTQGGLNVSRQWSTMAAFASNESIIERVRPSDTGSGTDATINRIFEIRLEVRPTDDRQNATFFAPTRTNYGHAGAAYAAYLATHHAEAVGLLGALMKQLEAELEVESDERFWIMAISTLVVGAALARKLGLVLFDPAALRTYLVREFHGMRTKKVAAVTSMGASEIIRDLMADLYPETLTIDELPGRGTSKAPTVISFPMRTEIIKAMHAVNDRILRIRASVFDEWMAQKKFGAAGVVRQLKELSAITENALYDLGAATQFKRSRVRCHAIDLAKLNL